MSAAASQPAAKGRWLFGPGTDLLLGCGVAYALFFGWMVFDGDRVRAWLPLALQPLLLLLFGGAHYGATLLRVYERREDRRRYAFFAIYVSVLLAMLFVWGLNSYTVGSWIVTVYLTWSPWHYSGQNYGVALMFLRRRHATITPMAKRMIYLTFLLSFGLVALTLHSIDPEATYAPASYTGTVFTFQSIGIPSDVAFPLAMLVLAGYLACLIGATVLLKRHATWRDLGPSGVLVGTQALWFLLPSVARYWGAFGLLDPFDPTHAAYTFMWVAMGHFLQYLWITAYYAAQAGQSRSHAHFLGKCVLAGVAIWTVPLILFAPSLLGRLPTDMGLSLLAAAVVNLHHFVLDGAIWKLRDGRVARVLLKSAESDAAGPGPMAPRRAPRWALAAGWAAGLAILVRALAIPFETRQFNVAMDRDDYSRMVQSVERLSTLGVESPKLHTRLAAMSLRSNDIAEARRQIRRSLDLHLTPQAYNTLGQIHERRSNLSAAIEAYETALEMQPDNPTIMYRAGRIWLELGEPARARPLLERAAARLPGEKRIHYLLQRAIERSQTGG